MGWHTQANLDVSPRDGTGSCWGKNGCSFGLYKRGTHIVLPILDFSLHHPSIYLAVEYLTISPTDVQTAPYNKDTGDGRLRYVQLQVERDTGGICLSLVCNSDTVKGSQTQLSRLVKCLRVEKVAGVIGEDPKKKFWRVIWVHLNSGRAMLYLPGG